MIDVVGVSEGISCCIFTKKLTIKEIKCLYFYFIFTQSIVILELFLVSKLRRDKKKNQ